MTKRTAHIFEEKWRSDDVKLQEATDFSSLLISERVLLGLTKAGYKNPSPIQVEAVPVGRFGNDLVVQAKSGTGKTLVFTIIALDILSIELKVPQVLILAPTREIASQICDVVKAVGCTTENLKCGTFIGGLPVEMDFLNVQGCQIVVGTPGRIKQLLELKILKGHSIRLLVLDEADQLLDPSFKTALDSIFQSLPTHKQIVATSATYPKSLAKLVNVYFRPNPSFARLNESDPALLGIVHFTCLVENTQMPVLAYRRKLKALETILTRMKFSQCLVFCNQVSRVETLCSDIKKFGFSVTYISSAKDQAARLKAIDSLKRFKCKILVTSDITSRGIDAENVDLIINVDLPYATEVYLHRVGRAGRYGSKGVAITFVSLSELCSFAKIQKEGNFTAYDLPDPVPENLINWRPKRKLYEEKSNDGKSSLSENLNNSSKSNPEESDDNQSTSSEDTAVNGKTSPGDSAVNGKTSPGDSAVNGKTSPGDSVGNQNTNSEDSVGNQNTNSEDSVVNQNTSSEDSAVSRSSEDTSVNHSTSSEDTSVNHSTSSEDTSVNQSTGSEDTSVNKSTSSEDTSVNKSTSSDMSANPKNGFEGTSLNKNICSKKTLSTKTVLTSVGVVGESTVDKASDKIIGGDFGDVFVLNSKDSAPKGEVDKKCVLNECKGKKLKNCTKVSKQKKSTSTALLNSEQICLYGAGKETGNSLTENKLKKEKCEDQITLFVMNFIDGYEKKNTPNLSYPLVDNGDKPLCLSSKQTNNSNNPLIRRNLIDYYYKVFQSFKSDFIVDYGIEQLELMMAGNEESSVEKKDEKCAVVHTERDQVPIADPINLSLWAKKFENSTYSESNCTDDSDVDCSVEDILVSTPNAKASKANNQLVVSTNTPSFPSSFDYQDTGDSSGSKYSSKCLQLENVHKSKIGSINEIQVPKNPNRKEQKVASPDSDSSTESETTSSSDTDVENAYNTKRVAVTKKQITKHSENLKSEVQNITCSDTESETTSSSDTDSSSNCAESNYIKLLEKGFKVMVRSKNESKSLAEQGDQLMQILREIQGNGENGSDSLSDIQITTAGAHSSRMSHCGKKSSMKSESSKIPRSAGHASGSSNLKGQRSKHQSDDEEKSVSYSEEESVSYSSKSNCSEKRKVSKLTKDKTSQRVTGLSGQLNRNEDFRVAEPSNFYFSHPHTSRHVEGSHFHHLDHFQNSVLPNAGHNINPRSSQYPGHRSSCNHHSNYPNTAHARQNSSSQPTHCHHSYRGQLQNASHPNQGHSRSTQHCHGINGSTIRPLSSTSFDDTYYRQWYWIQQGSFFH